MKKEGDSLVAVEQEVEDETKDLLLSIQETKSLKNPKLLADLKKRKLVKVEKVQTYTVTKGAKFAKEMPVEHTDLTADMLADGSWETAVSTHSFNPKDIADESRCRTTNPTTSMLSAPRKHRGHSIH